MTLCLEARTVSDQTRRWHPAAVLLDLDGTLVDSERAVMRAWQWAAIALQVPFEAVDPFTHGIPVDQALTLSAPHVDEGERRRIGFEILRRQADPSVPVVLLPGAGSLMTHLAGSQWGIVTSGDLQLARSSMSKAGVPQPPVLVTADDVTQGKPHPEPFILAAELLGVPPEDCLVIEDSPAGIQAGKEAGMQVVAVATSHDSWRLDHADQIIRSLEYISPCG
jgi:sugar-phosphatase